MFHESKGFKKLMLFPNVKVTPELAQDFLTYNTHNRPIKDKTVKKYTADMLNDRWEFTGDVINWTVEGKMINGQHRLLAIIASGKAQVFHVQCGLKADAFNKMDIGKLRSAGDTLAMQGFSNYSVVAGVVRYVSVYKNDMLNDYINTTNKMKFSNQDIAEEAEKLDRELLQEAATTSVKFYGRVKFMDSTSIAPLFYIFAEKDKEMALNFFDMLATGDGIGTEKYPSIFLLRNKLINSMSSGSKISVKHRWALIIKAWNFYKEGRDIKLLTWNESQEAFPKPI